MMNLAAPGFFGLVVCRTRAIDDACRDTLVAGAAQVVILGAGMDTRPYRLAEMRSARVWEFDLPAVQDTKKAAITRALGDLQPHVHYVPADLATQQIADLLAANGFDPGMRTLLVCEAVSQYLPSAAAADIVAFAGTLPSGSRLVFTYVPSSVLASTRHARRARHLHWQTSFDPHALTELVAAQGLVLLAEMGEREFRERLLQPRERHLDLVEIDRVVVAETYES